jgi:hypothetical protein
VVSEACRIDRGLSPLSGRIAVAATAGLTGANHLPVPAHPEAGALVQQGLAVDHLDVAARVARHLNRGLDAAEIVQILR